MQALALSLCILTGVVDVKNDNTLVLEVTTSDQREVEYVTLTSEDFPPTFREGETITIITFLDGELTEYCQQPL